MKAMILAAGLGTRLRPWTLSHPKALVPVGGVPMLERVINKLCDQGFDYIVVNVHHFAEQIEAFLSSRDFGVEIVISDERSRLLDTGGAIVHASSLLRLDDGPVLVHNVDIVSNADLKVLMECHQEMDADVTLLLSERESSRKLLFDKDMRLRGWHNIKEGRYRPEGLRPFVDDMEYAFSGIYVIGKGAVNEMGEIYGDEKFSIIDYLVYPGRRSRVVGINQSDYVFVDIGKPATLSQAQGLFD